MEGWWVIGRAYLGRRGECLKRGGVTVLGEPAELTQGFLVMLINSCGSILFLRHSDCNALGDYRASPIRRGADHFGVSGAYLK